MATDAEPTLTHPARPLSPGARVDRGQHEGIEYELRASSRSEPELLADARLCSQPLYELYVDGGTKPVQQVRVRAELEGNGVRAELLGPLGVASATFDRLPALDEVEPLLREWLSEVAGRRREL